MWLKSIFLLAFVLLVAANPVTAQFGSRQGPTTPPTFPQQKSSDRSDLVDINSASKEDVRDKPGGGEKIDVENSAKLSLKKEEELENKKNGMEKVIKQISYKITCNLPKK